MTRRTGAVLVALLVAAGLVVAGFAVAGRSPAPAPSPTATGDDGGTEGTDDTALAEPRTAAESAEEFLADWVDDGRVVRRDQGGDTVSEGQAYGLLLAVVADDADAFAAIWDWTQEHLVRSDGLLAWRWADGAVVDAEPASDADLDAARALVLAGAVWDEPAYTEAGTALATVLADDLTVTTALGRVLAPGLWATAADPYGYNPSYASPAAYAVLGDATGDPRWAELATGSAAATTALLDGSPLPPDWAQVHGDGTTEAMPGAAGTGQSVRYAYDAARLPVRYAESCDAADVALAGRLTGPLGTGDHLDAALDLGGATLDAAEHPVAYVGRAAARAAEGDTRGATEDLARADRVAQEVPTYYGAAWAALGRALLETDVLGGCPALVPQDAP
ncbi:glycosyl hydrolase family 8 [Cellulomonas triticagri]|uniref:glycosyl hydrolase family 8 n=1 Tax=Cellulomonas triticagri TaxID=2483352 RepID=UPI0013152021|nr:glycosyl hydrolase family 8 [Cellulomonas triticagri]